MPKVVRCPNCHAPLQIEDPQKPILQCQYCHADVKQTIYQVPEPPRPKLERPPLQIEIRQAVPPQAARNVKVILWVSILTTLIPVGIGVFVTTMSSRRAADAVRTATAIGTSARGTAAPSDPEQLLGEKLAVYGDCLSNSNRVFWSRGRYLAWVADPRSGPTCKETCIGWGISTINLYRDPTSGCLGKLAKARLAPPSLPALEAAGDRFAAALDGIDKLLDEGHRYLDQKDYKEDGCAKGRELHGRLMPAYAAYEKAEAEVRAILDKEHPALLERRQQRAQAAEPGGIKAHYFQHLLEARRLIDRIVQAEAGGGGQDGVREQIQRLSSSLDATVAAEEKLPATVSGAMGYFLWPHTFVGRGKSATLELLKSAKEYLRSSEKASKRRGRSRSWHEDPYYQVIDQYNRFLGSVKEAGYEALHPQRHNRC